jgi:MGT family glycosyltransferase
MTTYAVFCTPGYGHVNPTLALAQELVARGERVIYYLSEDFRPAVEATGAVFRLYESEAWKKYLSLLTSTSTRTLDLDDRIGFLSSMATLALESVREIPHLLEQMVADQIECVLYDRMFLQGIFTSKALHLPAIQLLPSFAVNEHVFPQLAGQKRYDSRPSQEQVATLRERLAVFEEKLSRECERYKLPHFTLQHLLGQVENLNIVFLPRAFQLAGETFDERYLFVGPSLPAQRSDSGDFPLERLEKRPLLYISLGTAFNDQVDFYQMCLDAFAQSRWQVVLSFGTRIDPAALKEPPANFLIAPHVPQLEVLSRADLFISHGGMNSTMESLWFGVPLVVVPQMMEQEINARRVQELVLGLTLEKETLTTEKLRAAVSQMTHNADFHARVQEMQQEMRQAGGYRRAVDEIIRYTHSA